MCPSGAVSKVSCQRRNIITNVHSSSCSTSVFLCPILVKLEFDRYILVKIPKMNVHKDAYSERHWQTDRNKEANIRCSQSF